MIQTTVIAGFYGITPRCVHASKPRDVTAGVTGPNPTLRVERAARSATLISSGIRAAYASYGHTKFSPPASCASLVRGNPEVPQRRVIETDPPLIFAPSEGLEALIRSLDPVTPAPRTISGLSKGQSEVPRTAFRASRRGPEAPKFP